MNKKGFTLAEVLMVLAIIGVIAAMTIPAILSSTRGKEYQTAAQKALSTLNSAMQLRYALEDESMEDYANSIGAYLTGEIEETKKRAMVGTKVYGSTNRECTGTGTCKIETQDSMIWFFPGKKATPETAGDCNEPTDGCLVWVDTNGVRGPTRNNMTADSIKCGGASGFNPATDNRTVSGGLSVEKNECPDIIALRIIDRSAEAADTRTRNIIATGHANVSQ